MTPVPRMKTLRMCNVTENVACSNSQLLVGSNSFHPFSSTTRDTLNPSEIKIFHSTRGVMIGHSPLGTKFSFNKVQTDYL